MRLLNNPLNCLLKICLSKEKKIICEKILRVLSELLAYSVRVSASGYRSAERHRFDLWPVTFISIIHRSSAEPISAVPRFKLAYVSNYPNEEKITIYFDS